MSVYNFQQGTMAGAAGAGGAVYEIDQSIRFNDDDTAYLTRTQDTGDSKRIATFSWWMKRGSNFGTESAVIAAAASSRFLVRFNTSNQLTLRLTNGTTEYTLTTNMVFRDPSAWYHCVWRIDVTQATPADRSQLYVNGSAVTFTGSSLPAQNTDVVGLADATTQRIGILSHTTAASKYDGYLAEFNYIDGQSLAPTDFGETNNYGVWIPKAYAGTYGTNGFYITGADSADLGADDSGNGNAFTSSGLAAADQVTDSPTKNQATLNTLFSGVTLSDGNLVATASGNSYQRAFSTFAIDDGGKHVCEFQKSSGTFGLIGIMQNGNHTNTTGNSNMFGINLGNGEVFRGNPTASVLTTLTAPANSLMRLEYDSSTDTLEIFDDGSSIYSGTVSLTGHDSLHFGCAPFGSGTVITATFSPLSGTPTTDFKELTTANLAAVTIPDGTQQFQALTYTGTGSARTQSGFNFQPDWLWIKARNGGTVTHRIHDIVRGDNGTTMYQLATSNTLAENNDTDVTGITSDGFTLGSDGSDHPNTSAVSYVAWAWKAAQSSGSSNEDGTITSTVSANPTAGFSIVTYTGDGNDNATVGHGLGVTPKTVMLFPRSNGDNRQVSNWENGVTAFTEDLKFNALEAANSSTSRVKGGSSTTFTLGTDANVNGSARTYVAYVFAEIDGYSKFGTFRGNGSTTDGPFIYTGFTPRYMMWRRTDSATNADWTIMDTARDPFNQVENNLRANSNIADDTGEADLDFVSNGIKHRGGTSARFNASGATYVYMAFAEYPFGGTFAGSALAPATAR